MAQIEPLNLFGAYARGKGVALDEQQARQAMESNRLRDMYLSNQEARTQAQFNASQQNQQANTEQAKRERAMAAAPLLGKLARDMLATGNPRQSMAAAVRNPEVQRLFADVGITPDQMDLNDPELEQDLQTWAQFAEQGKQAPQVNIMPGPMDSQIVTYGDTMRVLERDKPPAATQRRFRTLSQEEVTAAGLPAGTTAQQDEDTGQISVLSKRDATGGLSQKDQTTAKMKLNTVTLARNQLNVIRQNFDKLKGSMSAGPFGQGKVPTEQGRAFDRAVDQMRSTLTSLTRVPGVGAMSDYETRLDQAKFPTRNEYENVTQQQIDQLDSMLNAIESGYKDLLTGAGPAASQTQPSARQGAGGPVRVSTPAEAAKLPAGTQFVTPDGQVRVKR